jgi:predicted nucleic acid-binding protein
MKSSRKSAVAEHWVLNASPLIVLARIGHEDMFFALANQVVVPRAVALEIQAGPAEDRARKALEDGQFTIIDTPPPPPELLTWDLGAGETAVLSLALAEAGWTVILDDAAARRCAHSFSLPVKGTLAVVLLAKQRGLIASAAEVLRSLRATGFYLDVQTAREALIRTVGEEWPPDSS